MARILLNVLLRWLVKPIWRRKLSIESLRKQAARMDGWFGSAGMRVPAVTERLSNETNALWLGPRERSADGVILFLHGGAFCMYTPGLYREICADLSRRTGLPVLLPDYRLAPEHPAPASLDDCELAYRRLLREVSPQRIVLAGDSAGGNLSLALLHRCKRVGLPQPGGAVVMSPITEFKGDGWSMHFNAQRDVMFTLDALAVVVGYYLPTMREDDPEVSPLYGDWSGLPALMFHVSSAEMLLDHSMRAVERARLQGVDANAKVWLDLPHAFPMFGMLTETEQCRAEMAAFITERVADSHAEVPVFASCEKLAEEVRAPALPMPFPHDPPCAANQALSGGRQ